MAYEDEEPKARKRSKTPGRGKTLQAKRAAKVYLEDGLGWLNGYPVGPSVTLASSGSGGPSEDRRIPWRVPTAAGGWRDVTLDRELLRTSFYTLRGAHRKFPRALERVVGDVGVWSKAVESRLRHLQRAVHDGEAILQPSGSGPQPIARAELQWMAAADPDLAERASTLLGPWRTALARVEEAVGRNHSVRLAVEVIAQATDPERLGPALAILEHPRCMGTPTRAEGPVIQALKALGATKKGPPPGAPGASFLCIPDDAPTLGKTLVDFLLADPDERVRDLTLGSLSAIQLGEWQAWWASVAECRQEAEVLESLRAKSPRSTRTLRDLASLVAARAEALLQSLPRTTAIAHLAGQARAALRDCAPETVQMIQRCLDQLPDSGTRVPAPRSEFVQSAARTLHSLGERRRTALLEGLAERLVSPAGRALAPHRRLLAAHFLTETVLEFEWRGDEVPWSQADTILDATLELCGPESSEAWLERQVNDWRFSGAFEGLAIEVTAPRRLADMLRASDNLCTWDVATVGARFACRREVHAPVPCDPPQRLSHQSPDRPLVDTIGDAAYWKVWQAIDERDDAGVRALRRATDQACLHGELRQAAAAGIEPHELIRFARLWLRAKKGLAVSGAAAPSEFPQTAADLSELATWIPARVLPAVKRLLDHADRASVAKVVSPTLQDPEAQHREVTGIRTRLAEKGLPPTKRTSLEARLGMLEQRLLKAVLPSADQEEDLIERLDSAAQRARLRRWIDKLQSTIIASLSPAARAAIDWTLDRQADLVLTGFSELSVKARTLGHRLLEERAGPPPWDLRDAPENLRWRAQAEAQGLRLDRWFSAESFSTDRPPPEGEALVFALEDDPLEVMKMGLWFDTCLAPGNMNFFSTMANAADANKRLLVARDMRGVAQARCLLAITESWHLLAFHVYAHERGDWVRSVVRDMVLDLASQLGTRPAPIGQVPTTIAPGWYDDGPVDVTEQLARLLEAGDLGQRLLESPDEDAFKIATDGLGRDVVEAALEQVLGLPLLSMSPARTASFAPLLTGKRLPRSLAIRTIEVLAKQQPELARELVQELLRGRPVSRIPFGWGEDFALARSLRLLGDPGRALRLLRGRLDMNGQEDLQHETALSLAALGRPQQAIQLWESLAANGDERAAKHLETHGAADGDS